MGIETEITKRNVPGQHEPTAPSTPVEPLQRKYAPEVSALVDPLASAARQLGFAVVPPYLSLLPDGTVFCRCGLDLGAVSAIPGRLQVQGDLLLGEDCAVDALPADLVVSGRLKLNERLSDAYRAGRLAIPAGAPNVRIRPSRSAADSANAA